VRFEVPAGADRDARLASVLEVIYLIFNEGYSATAGEYWVRPALCEEALRLGRILAELAPTEPEVHGLVGLMEIQASRLGARVGPGCRRGNGVWSGFRTRPRRRARPRARAQVVPLTFRRPRRPPEEARAVRGGARRVRARRIADGERAGARPSPETSCGVCRG